VTNEFYGRWSVEELGKRSEKYGWFEKKAKSTEDL